MSSDKYGSDQAPDCYPGTDVLVNLLDLKNPEDLDEAERYVTEVVSTQLEFLEPPYSVSTLKQIHRTLFAQVYAWAGEIRTVGISKGDTRFCSPEFIEREIHRELTKIASAGWFEGYSRHTLVSAVAESYGTLNVAPIQRRQWANPAHSLRMDHRQRRFLNRLERGQPSRMD